MEVGLALGCLGTILVIPWGLRTFIAMYVCSPGQMFTAVLS